jgi:hypothetical protein
MLRCQYRVRAAETVKFGRSARAHLFALSAVGLVTSSVLGDPLEPPLLLGGAADRPSHVVETDPRLPVGAAFETRDRPTGGERVCAVSRPVCVHGFRGADPKLLLEALDALERAFARTTVGLALPAPLGDEGRGGSDALDLYLLPSDRVTPSYARVHVYPDLPRLGGFDRASGFCTAMADPPALLERAATLCVGEALALALDPAETPDVRRAFATELWWVVGEPTSFDFEAIDRVQRRPGEASAARELSAASEGHALFLEYLDARLGVGGPLDFSTALLAASAQATPADSPTWQNEPDWFDVLRHTLAPGEAQMAELLGDFAVDRAFLGEREDGRHLPLLAWSGFFGTPNFDWVIPFSTLPRRVQLTPLEPTGAALVWVDLTGAPQGFTLGLKVEWEPPAEFQWELVEVGADGELSRLRVPFEERGTSAEARLVNVHDARAVIVAGTHLERVDADHPFDPDVAPFEPHGASVYLVEL